MSGTIVQTTTTTGDSFKEAVPDRRTQPGLEAVFQQGPGFGYPAQNGYGYGHGHGYSGPPVQQGIGKKKLFWLWVALGVLVAAVIGLAVGLGVGLAKNGGSGTESEAVSSQPSPTETNNDSSNDETSPATPSSSSSSSSSPSSSPTTTPTSTYTSPFDNDSLDSTITLSGVQQTPQPSPTSICPNANGTVVVHLPGPKRYRIFCDSDFAATGKKDLASIVLGSFDECLGLCNTMNYFQEREDVGCTYNVDGTGDQTPGTCWCLGGSLDVVTNVGNEVAMPID
ncbi:hypothetical protein ASPVEDRAFT_151215 [Aspergillus versicolor CBS 583.65]|uniref:Apple domain-containing protein n=1 Tax=Aspergillus versicolor CBS 583.65 TaxID=1036611 RepID=A0A1L9PM91_ASPVE|nr:uncharacterized protein ASPVEDRAFT_151215 [Aspergillus versicolor CBS 583.65]OJJ02592.1 hypothetical protein ASPVEDRAFT_151215 [Aspergillus versicolor CBS 583.65]